MTRLWLAGDGVDSSFTTQALACSSPSITCNLLVIETAMNYSFAEAAQLHLPEMVGGLRLPELVLDLPEMVVERCLGFTK